MREEFSPIFGCVLESTAIAQKAAKYHCFSSTPAGETFVRPMWISDRPKSKMFLVFGTGEVQSEFHGLGTTHASYVIGDLTKFTDFSAHAAGETFVRPMWVSD